MRFSERVVQLRLTGAIVFEGAIARAGTIVEMVESEAKDLLRRGKAELHSVLGDDDADDADTNAAAAQASADATAQGTTELPPNALPSRAKPKAK
jgi:hypothetical protein